MVVKRAYRDAAGALQTASTVGRLEYDGLGRRAVKEITHSADWNQTYVTYYNGQQMIEVRNDNSQVLKQYTWGLGYIDELVQVAINQDPANAATATNAENACERFFWALQGVNFNVYGIVSASGDLVERYEYTPYGQRTVYSRGWLRADLNGDGVVDDADTELLGTYWDTTAVSVADISGDGSVGLADLTGLSLNFGQSVADDPLVMHSRLESFRTDSQCGSSGGYGSLCDIGHQGLLHDKEFGPAATGLVHNRARTLNPPLARFNQQDPGPAAAEGATEVWHADVPRPEDSVPPVDILSSYTDGMTLYQTGRSAPTMNIDPTGRVIVLLAGAGQGPGTMRAIGDEIKRRLRVYLAPYTEGPWPWIMTTTFAKGGLFDDYDAAVRKAYREYVARRRANPCSLEQFVAIGHSSGASGIYNELWRGTFARVKDSHNSRNRIQPAYLGFVDMVLKKKPGWLAGPTLVGKLPTLTGAMHIKMPIRPSIKGIYNRNTAQLGIPVIDHLSMPYHPETVRWFGMFAATYYWRHVDWETRDGSPPSFLVTPDPDDNATW